MVRQKVEFKKIEDKTKRKVTFCKRRKSLFKKAEDLGSKCEAQIAIITSSLTRKTYAYGYPSVDSVMKSYAALCKTRNDDHQKNQIQRAVDHFEKNSEMGFAEKKESDHEKDLILLGNNQEGDENVEGRAISKLPFWKFPEVNRMQIDELERFLMYMESMKKKVMDRVNELRSTANQDSSLPNGNSV